MAVNASAAYAVYPQNVALNEVVRTLTQAGFDKENFCLMLSPTHPIASIVRDTNCGAFNVDANVVSAGLLGWLTGFGAVVIPTFGFFIKSREYFRALVSDLDSVGFCDRSGTLASLGFTAADATRLEKQLRETGVLLYVSCAEPARARWALELLRPAAPTESGLIGSEVLAEQIPERIPVGKMPIPLAPTNGMRQSAAAL
jgi:hypothetical protein